jgi:hypothetical protein
MPRGAQIRRGRVIIRPVIEADFKQWLALWKGYNAFYDRAGKTSGCYGGRGSVRVDLNQKGCDCCRNLNPGVTMRSADR